MKGEEVELIMDNSDQWHYGKARFPQIPYITRENNGPGTSRKRKYLAVMIKNGATYLYCGRDIIKMEHSNLPYIMEVCDRPINMGLIIWYLVGDG
ncbi:MAG: hypothetical protein ACTSU2_00170 [Promethearchaeota archaeon]